ncbi:hypothetical protein MMPV_010105 [Pyropia vietnamensis]
MGFFRTAVLATIAVAAIISAASSAVASMAACGCIDANTAGTPACDACSTFDACQDACCDACPGPDPLCASAVVKVVCPWSDRVATTPGGEGSAATASRQYYRPYETVLPTPEPTTRPTPSYY